MVSPEAQYTELKPQISAIADELFALSERFLKNRGNFLPHAAVLTVDGTIRLVAAAPTGGRGQTNSTEVLPLLHAGLREEARTSSLLAIGIAENVTVTLEGQKPTEAIKVLFEHRSGFVVAIYTPFEKKLLRGYTFGEIFSKLAEGEVFAWGQGVA